MKTNGELAAFQALADPTRHAIFQRLKEAGLVSERREGTRRVYRIEPQGVWALRQSIDRMWSDALDAFQAAVEREGREEQ